jgi:hypothetical protein
VSERLPRPTPRGSFRADLRARLLAEAPSALVPAPRRAAWPRGLAAAALSVALAAGANAAAADSLPGEAPFLVKRTVEEARLLLAFEETSRIEVLAEHADARLSELRRAAAPYRPTNLTEACVSLADALGRLAGEVAKLKGRVQGDASAGEGRAVARAEMAASEHAVTIAALLSNAPADAPATTKAALERAAEEARKIRASPTPTPSPSPGRERTPTPSPTPSPSGR